MTASRPRTVLIMAGGTGGHVFPALAVANRLRESGVDVHWLGTRHGIEAEVIPAAGIPISYIRISGLRGNGILRLLGAPLRICQAVLDAIRVVRTLKPVSVLGMGGFASGPGGIAAWLMRKPLIIHEQNSIAGMTNRILSKFAKVVLEAFPGSFGPSSKAVCVGNPVRKDLRDIAEPVGRVMAHGGRPRLLVLGGSLGALAINECVPLALARMESEKRPEVWHQSGKRHLDVTEAAYRENGVEGTVSAFIDHMNEAYAWADLVLCRSGAMTITELTVAGLGSVLIPFPHAVDDHQTINAEFLVGAGAGKLLPQTEMNPDVLGELLAELLGDPERLVSMARAARGLAKPGATEDVAEKCLEVACG